jgi:hypothetical protein
LSTQQSLANVQAMARGKGVIAGVVASWLKALSEPPLQAAAERMWSRSRWSGSTTERSLRT